MGQADAHYVQFLDAFNVQVLQHAKLVIVHRIIIFYQIIHVIYAQHLYIQIHRLKIVRHVLSLAV
jgi:hypothetical protein